MIPGYWISNGGPLEDPFTNAEFGAARIYHCGGIGLGIYP